MAEEKLHHKSCPRKALTAERLRSIVRYDRETGQFTSLVKRAMLSVGDLLGTVNARGYVVLSVDGRSYFAHRLAWFYERGEWAPQVDHRNGVRSDNRFSNLRSATHAQNLHNRGRNKNNTSGFKGVSRVGNRWRATITRDRVLVHIGRFATKEEAHSAYSAAAAKLHGEFARAR